MLNDEDTVIPYPPFSVSMCVYKGDNAEWFESALNSIMNQSVQPSEIVLVVDGPIPEETEYVLERFEKACEGIINFKVIRLERNSGHGIARRTSVANCGNELVALMDADDIASSDRFECELSFFLKQDIDLVGGDIAEFIGHVDNVVGYRKVPTTNADICKYIKKRCPFNQMTVMFRKTAYEKAGGYLDWYCDEDYYLWIRMMLAGCKFANTGTIMVNVRVGEDMYRRRGGIKYFRSEAKLQKYMLDKKIISLGRYLINVSERLVLQVLMPNSIRGFIFKKFAREK